MTDNTMSIRGEGRAGVYIRQGYPHAEQLVDVSVELPNAPWGGFPGSGPPTMATFGLEQRIDVLSQEIRQLKQLIYDMSQQLQSLQEVELEETSEILNLPPLSKKRVNVKVRKREPARFRFVENGEETDSDDTEG